MGRSKPLTWEDWLLRRLRDRPGQPGRGHPAYRGLHGRAVGRHGDRGLRAVDLDWVFVD